MSGGGRCSYDYEYNDRGDYRPKAKARGPKFLHKLVGLDYFATVTRLDGGNAANDAIDDLSQLADLKELQHLGFCTTSDNLAPLSRLTNLETLGLPSV